MSSRLRGTAAHRPAGRFARWPLGLVLTVVPATLPPTPAGAVSAGQSD
jgi:hypothetical protein